MDNKKSESKNQKKAFNDWKRVLKIFAFIRPYRWYFIVGLILLGVSSSLFMIFPGAAGEMANTAVGKSRFDFSVKDYGLLFLVILIVQGVFSYYRAVLFAHVSEKGMADVRKTLYNKLLTLSIYFFEEKRVGELTSRITADVEKLQSAFSITLAEFIRQIVILIIGTGILGWLAPQLSLTMLMTFPVIVILAVWFGRYIRKISRLRQDELAKTNVIVEETFMSFREVKSFTNEWWESMRYAQSVNEIVRISIKFARIRGLFFIFIITILFGGIFFILWRGAILVEAGEMEVGDLFSFIIYTGILGGAIASLGNLYTDLAGAMGATERILDILEEGSEIELLDHTDVNIARAAGHIRFENVSFSYPSRRDIPVLRDFNVEIEAGKKVALVGMSGAGKSTILQILMRFYPLTSGGIYLDSKNIEDYDLHGYRSQFAIVPQDVLLFGGTIRENILYGKSNASDEELIEAATQGNAWEFISQFPEKFDTIVGDRGIKLSGGQRQRIAIARAILRDPAVLLLDEATSSLDAESESVVQDALNHLMENRTSIIVAHRLSTIMNADRIYVLENGRIAESGTHEELSSRDGAYARLARLQFQDNLTTP